MLFAQANPPVEIAAWLGCLAFLVVLANGVLKLVDRVKGKPSPGEVQAEAAEKFTRKEEFERQVATNEQVHRDLFSKIGGVERGNNANAEKKIEELRHERREDMRVLHEEINDIGNDVAGLKKETELQNQTLTAVTTDIKRILERLPRRHDS